MCDIFGQNLLSQDYETTPAKSVRHLPKYFGSLDSSLPWMYIIVRFVHFYIILPHVVENVYLNVCVKMMKTLSSKSVIQEMTAMQTN